MEIAIAVAAKIAEYTVRPVGQWLCYSCHYKSNMENLKKLEKTLRDAKNRVRHDVDAALNNGDKIQDDVKTWLKKVDDIIKKLGGGAEEAESRNSNPSCLDLKRRHQMSREAKQMVGNIAELLENGKFVNGVSYRPAAQEMVTPRNVDYMTFDSRISITKRIMEALGDANINKIGVWGLAGVGKSTLMKEIFRKAKEESLFDEVALANVTDSPNLSRIQGEIADMLDLNLDPNITEKGRAARLRARLENDEAKKILVILDDIWKQLDLEEIGITPSERCKVLLTSRDLHVLSSEMGTKLENNFKLDTLGGEEAWNLFEKMAGDTVKDDRGDLRNEAIKVAKECGGLPIALVTVSRSLKNEKNLGIWKDALVQLTRPTPDTKIWSPVYSCIQLSYKRLDGSELKSLFLLCARQGYYIFNSDLLRYGFALCLFDEIDTLEEARNRLETLVRGLQDACLLLQSPHSSEEFYMHDLVRHVATIIASNDHNMFVMRGDGGQKAWPDVDSLKRCKALSIHGGDHIHKYPNKIECPKLRYFDVQCEHRDLKTPNSSFQGMEKLEDIFFQGMEKLEVLSLTNIKLSSLLPLTNLQTLCLDGCELGDIHWIGELKTLVILSLAYSDISNLPRKIGLLTGLRLLDLTDCSSLRVIPPNVLSSLVKLEELYMRNINVQWEVEGPNNEGKNASLAELKHLSHLITFEIDIKDAKNLPKDLFSEKLERYKICIGYICIPFYYKVEAFSRSLALGLNRSFQLDFGIKMLLKRTEYLFLDDSNSTKSVFSELDREDFKKLKHLHIKNSWHLPELRISFKNLKVLEVENCEKLRFIFSSSIARGLSLLEELKIRRCSNVGAIFVKEEEDHGIEEVFRRLETLVLMDLPKLVSFFSTRETNSEGNHDLQLPLLHHQLSFPNLKYLGLQHLPKIKHVWSNVNGCESLKSLNIEDCGVMEEIVAREDGTDPTTRLLFPSLTRLNLHGLPKLKWFFQGMRTLESSSSKELHEQGGTLFGIKEVAFPNLTNLYLLGLPKIKHVWSKDRQTILRFQNLQEISVEGCASLKSLFQASVGGCLKQLKKIKIDDCGVEEIVEAEGGEAMGRMLVFEFPQLTSLDLAKLPRLECFYKGVYISKWPMLETMSIEKCKKVEVFASGLMSFEETVEERQYSQMSIKQPLFLVDEISFPSLELLTISKMEKLGVIWYGQVAASPTKLDISCCGSLEAVFEKHEEQNGKESHALTVTQRLREVHLSFLPKLRNIWNIKDSHQRHMYSFPNLLDIEVGHCESLKSLFPAWVGGCLKQLKKIKIDDCGVEEIVGAEGGEAMGRTLVFEFPQLTSLDLAKLPRLDCFYRGVYISKWPMLKMMLIKECKKVEVFASGLMSFEETVEERQYSQMSIKQPLFLVNELSFPSLKKLHIQDMYKLEIIWQDPVAASSFSHIQDVQIHGCEKLLHVFQSNFRTTTILTQRLTRLFIEDCSSLETIFRNMEGHNGKEPRVLIAPSSGMEESVAREDGTARHIVFPILTEMRLGWLPKLKWILEGVHTNLECPSLEILQLGECEQVIWAFKFALPNLLELRLGYSSREEIISYELVDPVPVRLKRLELDSLPMLAHLWKEDSTQPCPLFHTLEFLTLYRCDKLRNIVPSSVFLQNLTDLHIWYCDGLINLLTSSTAETLVQLQRMTVGNCKMITEIVAMEDGEANVTITFNKLAYLKFKDLPNLTHFCSGPYSFGFPSLEELFVTGCPEMKPFYDSLKYCTELKFVYLT